MSWRQPSAYEQALLDEQREQSPALPPLAALLCLAPRIEPLLLRNARRHFLPTSATELEALLWFSPLVAARGNHEIVLHAGIARRLADGLPTTAAAAHGAPTRDQVWDFTRRHTRHWTVADRLERDLRYQQLIGDTDAQRAGLKAILGRVLRENDEATRIDLARLAKRVLPLVIPSPTPPHAPPPREAQLLAHYAALALGDAGDWAQPGPPRVLPPALAARLPAPFGDDARLGCELRYDEQTGKQLLYLSDSSDPDTTIRFPGPLPGRLHIAADGHSGDWHAVTRGSRIPIDPPSPGLRLTTLDGHQWDLRSDALPAPREQTSGSAPAPLRLIHVGADREQAEFIAAWLRKRDITVELIDTTDAPPGEAGPADPEERDLRLWSHATGAWWAEQQTNPETATNAGLLLRIDDAELPAGAQSSGQLLDWPADDQPERAEQLLAQLNRWWRDGELEPEPQSDPDPDPEPNEISGAVEAPASKVGGVAKKSTRSPATDDAPHRREIERLLAEIDDPATQPPRRLAIGDRLAELGDPRPGVGTVEIEVPNEVSAAPAGATPPSPAAKAVSAQPNYPPAVLVLLDELNNPGTEPPRRLKIGDELDRIGDPRPGVGLNADGLPDIAWIEVPAGPFIYQDNETRELPAFGIARYPVTNRQYQAFIDDGGYRDKSWWRDLKHPKKRKPRWTQSNRPRTNVDWYEAVAFCRWFSAKLDLEVRLPTEPEWEQVARGTDGRHYPWGNEFRSGFANVDEKEQDDGPWYLQQTTAVGLYPHGRSPIDVHDLSGTVWEWCLNRHEDTEVVTIDKSGALRALRGGSWVNDPDSARADGRGRYQPDFRNDNAGFRVLCSVPIFS